MNILTLWHGGRNLEHNYNFFQSSKKGSWEHGPGIYLTTHYERAASYAKGGGTTYLVEIHEGNHIDNVKISLNKVYEFINSYVIKKRAKEVIDRIKENSNRTSDGESIKASYFLNIMINFNAVNSSQTTHLNKFLVDSGADYDTVNNFGGRPETVFVIFNNKLIHKVTTVFSKQVQLSQWELPVDFSVKKSLTI